MSHNKLQSLSEIFNQKFFRIPDFQRGYSWEKRQFEDFWEDLSNLKGDRLHYTGLLTVEPVSKEKIEQLETWQDDLWLFKKGLKPYYLIDGQQRLTTSIILINEMLKTLGDNDYINYTKASDLQEKFLFQSYGEYKSYIFGYEKDNPSDEYFKTKILNQHSSTADKTAQETLYTANLANAQKFFQDKLKACSQKEREEIFDKLTQKFQFNFYEIDNELDTYVTFETMNNRGKPLSNLELLKNRLIYISTLLEEDEELIKKLRKDINETWKTIYAFLGKNKDNPMNDDDFLHNHWIMYFPFEKGEKRAYAKFLLNKKFTAKNAINKDLQLLEIQKYIQSLQQCVQSWFYLYNPQFSSYTDETKEWLKKLNRLGMGAFPPILMASLTNYDEDQFLPLIKAIERFRFLIFEVTNRPSHTKTTHIYKLAKAFYFEENISFSFYKDGIEKELTITIDNLIKEINWLIDGESGEGEEYAYDGLFDLNKFNSHIDDLFDRKDKEGFYSWSGIRYFLYEYELFLQEKNHEDEKTSWQTLARRKKENTIEHIYPQTANDKYWVENFAKFNSKQTKKLLHSLGNLLLLSRSKNSEQSNKSFEFKKKHRNSKGDMVGFYNGSHSEIEVNTYENWTALEIQQRGKKMLQFLKERWDMPIENWEITQNGWDTAQNQLLKLDFVNDNNNED